MDVGSNGSLIHSLNNSHSIPEHFHHWADTHPKNTVYTQPIEDYSLSTINGSREWLGVDYELAQERISRIANYLIDIGIKSGDRVAILSGTRPEWLETDIAVLTTGGIVVSVYHSLSASDVGFILSDSGARVVFAENREQVEKLISLKNKMVADPNAPRGGVVSVSIRKIISFERVTGYSEVTCLRDILADPERAPITPDTFKRINREDLASLVYTSGSSGAPKGVMQSHGNHLSNVRQAIEAELVPAKGRIFLVLPLAHSFARLCGYLGILGQAELALPGIYDREGSKFHKEKLRQDLAESDANVIPLVPGSLEKIRDGILEKSRESGLVAKMLSAAIKSGQDLYEFRRTEQPIPLALRVQHEITAPLRSLVVRKVFGDKLSHIISGGARLEPDIAHFFASLGVEICEGYGMTESCVATNVNRPGQQRFGSVGPAMGRDNEVKISEDGEILLRGPNVAKGYWKRPEATAQSFDSDGWLHTGDIGRIDQDGYLYITGRTTRRIDTAFGKKIQPEPIEAKLCSIPSVSHAVLVGNGRQYLTALLALNPELIRQHCEQSGVKLSQPLAKDPNVRALIESELAKVNQGLAHFESVRDFRVIPDELSIDNGLLTPTLKIRPAQILRRYAELVAEMYPA